MKSMQTHRIIKDRISYSNEDLSVNGGGNKILISQTPTATNHQPHPSSHGSLNNYNSNQVIMKKLAPISAREMIHARQEEIIQMKGGSAFSMGLPKIGNGEGGVALGNHPFQQPQMSDREQMSNLQKRVKDLEKENYRLNHHVQQAERTLKNYRDVYGAIPSDPIKGESTSSKNPGPQNTNKENISTAEANPLSLQQLQQQIHSLEKALKETLQKNQDANQELQKKNSQMKDLQTQSQQQIEQLKHQNKHLQGIHEKDEQQIFTFQTQITQLKEELIQYKMKMSANSVPPVKFQVHHEKQTQKKILSETLNSVRLVKEEYQNVKSSLEQEIELIKSYTNDRVEQLQNYFSLVLQNALQTIQTQKSEHAVYKVDSERKIYDLQEVIHQLQQTALDSAVKSPVKAISPIKPTESKSDIIALTEDISRLQKQSQDYQQKIEQTTQAIGSLSDLHSAEIKTIKHLAHIRELIRVAKEREQAIDKDRMIIEIKQLKEVQNVLTFALKAAEQSLSESQPQVVAKLVEGRSKRIKLIEQTYKGKLKDIEQRSMETCAVNTNHLEIFQTKAIENQQNAENMTKHATNELLLILKNPFTD